MRDVSSVWVSVVMVNICSVRESLPLEPAASEAIEKLKIQNRSLNIFFISY